MTFIMVANNIQIGRNIPSACVSAPGNSLARQSKQQRQVAGAYHYLTAGNTHNQGGAGGWSESERRCAPSGQLRPHSIKAQAATAVRLCLFMMRKNKMVD